MLIRLMKENEVKLDNSFGDFFNIERENAQMALNATIGLIKNKTSSIRRSK